MSKTIKALFHLDEDVMWRLALSNVSNLVNCTQEEISMEVVANGDAVAGYVDGCLQEIRKLSERGVNFVACANSLRAHGISAGELPEFVNVVGSGVMEIVLRQAEGYAYIKP